MMHGPINISILINSWLQLCMILRKAIHCTKLDISPTKVLHFYGAGDPPIHGIYTLFQNCWNTYSMVQSPSGEANWFAAIQEIPRISRNPKVHYRTHKRPPPASILGQPDPVHIPTSHLLTIHPNIIHPSTPRSPQWSINNNNLIKIHLFLVSCWNINIYLYTANKSKSVPLQARGAQSVPGS